MNFFFLLGGFENIFGGDACGGVACTHGGGGVQFEITGGWSN